ncbi:MAG: hypothetical protein ACREXT_16750, partial [Gammaproteobacteria bacterium]
MARSNEHMALAQGLVRLAEIGVVPRVATALDRGIPDVTRSLCQVVTAEVPAYSASGNPEVLPDLERHTGEHILEIRRLFAGGHIGDFQFVRTYGHRRAAQRFPLEAMLHAYRCCHKILAQWMRDATTAAAVGDFERAVPAIADFAIEYTNTISTILAAEYVEQARALAEAEGDRRTELLNILLAGFDEADGRVGRLLKRAGYFDQRQSFCVALAQSTEPLEMENPDRAQRIVEAIAKAAGTLHIRSLVGIRNNAVTAVLSDTRRLSGWTAPQTKLAARTRPALMLLGPAVLIGISSDQPSTAFIPKALHEASIALDFASVAERVVLFS